MNVDTNQLADDLLKRLQQNDKFKKLPPHLKKQAIKKLKSEAQKVLNMDEKSRDAYWETEKLKLNQEHKTRSNRAKRQRRNERR